ncbi:unnamed protein product [Microthlaspi erraticum]|uniref:Uracil-DNA glycosylase-like domain-containing protein n=1 Tax=Microthlaspi erraticum TaxID=1685480 RepID=A0A6D2KIQ4_9BRAS|nr:unnamed protein product [Microthlaspi erraticum]
MFAVVILRSGRENRRKEASGILIGPGGFFNAALVHRILEQSRKLSECNYSPHLQSRSRLIDGNKHHILTAAHPSGLSAHKGFFNCRHFSRSNQLLEQMGIPPIDWQL